MPKRDPAKVVKATVKRRAKVPARGSTAALKAPGDAVRACIEYAKILETEKTERARIRAKRDVAVEAIRSQRDLILKYFELRFAERRQALAKFFEQLGRGARTQDDVILDVALKGIVTIVKDNPLNDFDAFRQSMADPDQLLEL